jgi:deazaflavin-dependent oxidoreductase (nitroreductase family)
MTAQATQTPRRPPRFLIRTFWILHRAAYRVSGGRFGLSRPEAGGRFGMMRLATVGRRSGQPRLAIIGYYEDGSNLVTLAMNGWGEADPAWWLNLQANPDTMIGLANGPRAVRARAATGAERDRLWLRFREFPGWGDDIDSLAARRAKETAVVVFEPRQTEGDEAEEPLVSDDAREQRADSMPSAGSVARTDGEAGRRLRLRHLWVVPGLAIAFFANLQAERVGLGIVPLLAFGIAPDLPRLLGLGQPHAHGQMPRRAVPAFNLMHHPVPPVVILALAAIGVLPPVLYVGALVWLGHIVIGMGIGDRVRGRNGFLRPLWPIARPGARSVSPDAAGASTSAGSMA